MSNLNIFFEILIPLLFLVCGVIFLQTMVDLEFL